MDLNYHTFTCMEHPVSKANLEVYKLGSASNDSHVLRHNAHFVTHVKNKQKTFGCLLFFLELQFEAIPLLFFKSFKKPSHLSHKPMSVCCSRA